MLFNNLKGSMWNWSLVLVTMNKNIENDTHTSSLERYSYSGIFRVIFQNKRRRCFPKWKLIFSWIMEIEAIFFWQRRCSAPRTRGPFSQASQSNRSKRISVFKRSAIFQNVNCYSRIVRNERTLTHRSPNPGSARVCLLQAPGSGVILVGTHADSDADNTDLGEKVLQLVQEAEQTQCSEIQVELDALRWDFRDEYLSP